MHPLRKRLSCESPCVPTSFVNLQFIMYEHPRAVEYLIAQAARRPFKSRCRRAGDKYTTHEVLGITKTSPVPRKKNDSILLKRPLTKVGPRATRSL